MEQIMHRAAQYLATAAISFLEKKEDDSHTNLGWNEAISRMETRPLTGNGDQLSLNYKSFALEWIRNEEVLNKLSLQGKTHGDIVAWISDVSKNVGMDKAYSHSLHYDLPYEKLNDGFIYNLYHSEKINELIENRNKVHGALSEVLRMNNLTSEIRIWPHHFDSGAFAMVNDTLGIGLGMAMPDTMIDDFYLYVSGYHGHDFVDTSAFAPLKIGKVYSDGWKGIALPVKGLNRDDMTSFFNEAIARYT
ncbi:MAG: hypothetical protein Aureis2KO_19910 [Aureisphaera sp.]